MNNDVLIVQSIAKQFSSQKAVDDLSFAVKAGEIFALLGPNGAGKTTTIRMLLGIMKPDSGNITFELRQGTSESLSSAKLGYLPEDRGLYRDIPILKTLTYMGVLRGLSRKDATARAKLWLDRVGLGERANDKLETLSKGNQQKVQFISAVLHTPDFAVLDEPFSGLDPINQEAFIDIIRELRQQGMTILLCAHQMDLVERLADRVLLMNAGRRVLYGTLAQIREEAQAAGKIILTLDPAAEITALESLEIVQRVERRGAGEYAFFLRKSEHLRSFLREAAAHTEILGVNSERTSLHDIFVQAVRAGGDSIPEESQ